jgi:hypothetical protein
VRVAILREFAQPMECVILERHFNALKERGEFRQGFKDQTYTERSPGRWSTRWSEHHTTPHPAVVEDLRARIRAALSLWSAPIYDEGHGKDGVVVTITEPGSNTYRHKDPRPGAPGVELLRCNLLVRGQPHTVLVDDRPYRIGRRDLMAYLVTKHFHEVPEVPFVRTMVQFGFLIGEGAWEQGM